MTLSEMSKQLLRFPKHEVGFVFTARRGVVAVSRCPQSSSLPHDAGSLLSAGVHSLRLYRTTRGRCCRPVSIVCLSVCRVYALYPEDRLKISSNFFLGPVVPSFYFLTPSADTQFQVSMGVKYTGGENLHFSTEITVYLGNDARQADGCYEALIGNHRWWIDSCLFR